MNPERAFLDCDNQMPLRPGVRESILEGLDSYANPMSRSRRGNLSRTRLEHARSVLARALGAHPSEVVFVSSGSEANTWAIERVVMEGGRPPVAILVSPLEHVSVLTAAGSRSRQEGIPLIRLPIDPKGVVDLEQLDQMVAKTPGLVSVQWANPEMGLVQPISEIGNIVRKHGGLLHVDFIAAETMVPVRFFDLPIDLLTVSSARWGGPPGVAALVIRRGVRIKAMMGGGVPGRGAQGRVSACFPGRILGLCHHALGIPPDGGKTSSGTPVGPGGGVRVLS